MFVDDQTGTLSGSEIAKLQAIASNLDVKVRITARDTRGELDAEVGRMVTSANTLAIGIDPIHHYTFTHFGTGTGIARADFVSVARAGNGEFHQGHWADGIDAIVASASAASSRTAATGGVVVQPTTVVEHEATVWPFVAGGIGFAVAIIWAAVWLRRRQRKLDVAVAGLNDEAGQLRARNIEEQGWHDRMAAKAGLPKDAAVTAPAPLPVGAPAPRAVQAPGLYAPGVRVIPPAPQPVIAPVIIGTQPMGYGGGNDFLTGMLVGEALERPAAVERVERVERIERPVDTGYSGGSDSSSWDSGSSFDSGGSGGGFDSGAGGGFDGGSSGGDF